MSVTVFKKIPDPTASTFQYTTISAVESSIEGGLPDGTATAARILLVIQQMSEFLNEITGLWFSPKHLVVGCDGYDSPRVCHPQRIPIVRVNTVEIAWSRTRYRSYQARMREMLYSESSKETAITGTLDEDEIYLPPWPAYYVELGYGKFPSGRGNVVIDLNHCHEKVEVTFFQVHSKALPIPDAAFK